VAVLTVVDTDVLIDHFRGVKEAKAYIQALPIAQRATTDLTLMELFRGAVNREELDNIERFLERNQFVMLPVTPVSSRKGVQLLKQYVLSHGLSIPDALIAGIVLEGGARLVTGNRRHFDFIEGLPVDVPPYRML
jgi:predicted nucleic acid-binding protein